VTKTVADTRVVDGLVRRLERLTPATSRRWGTLSAHEMLCHLADASASVLARPGGGDAPARRVRKLLALYTSLPWPHGLRTPPHVDQRIGGTPPAVFALDRERAIAGLRALGSAAPNAFPTTHGHFGAMIPRDWQRWGYRHTDHHLRQFGL
jgi:hypothetical protein